MSMAESLSGPTGIDDFLRQLAAETDELAQENVTTGRKIKALREQIRLRLFALACAEETKDETVAIEDAVARMRDGQGFPDAKSPTEFVNSVRERAASRP